MRLARLCALGTLALTLRAQAPPRPMAPPAAIGDGWESVAPAEAGFDPESLQRALDAMMDGQTNLHGVIVERHGRLVAERYRQGRDKVVNHLFAYTLDSSPTTRHDTRSVGKSVIGLLVGVAIQQGKIKGTAAPVLDFYPEYGDLATPDRRAITLEHLLGMSSGLDWREGQPGRDDEHRLMWKWSPARYVLSRPIAAPPGTVFNYNSGGTALLADILGRVTGRPWKDFARTALFEPLGITDWEWVGDFYGRPMAYTGLRMRPRDMAKLGRLVLDRGRWQGRQLVPETWIEASLKPRLATGFEGTQYGYQWWTGTVDWQGRPCRWAAAFGNGAQRIYVVPDLDLTVVITAGAYGDLSAARRVQGFFKNLVAAVQR